MEFLEVSFGPNVIQRGYHSTKNRIFIRTIWFSVGLNTTLSQRKRARVDLNKVKAGSLEEQHAC